MIVEKIQDAGSTGCLFFRTPVVNDAPAVHALLVRCGGMDINSRQSYLLLCEHFASTCVIGEQDGHIVAFISSYILPERHDTLFVWQLAVDQDLRGQGVAKKLFRHLLSRRNLKRIRYVEAMVNPSNKVARPLFQALAKECHCEMDGLMVFPAEMFGGGDHDKEYLIRVGPIGSVSKTLIGRR